MNEYTARLFQIDPSGAWVTPEFNYHDYAKEGPHLLVTYVWGVAAYSPKLLGFNEYMNWRFDNQGNKIGGTMTLSELDESTGRESVVEYEMLQDEPHSTRFEFQAVCVRTYHATLKDSDVEVTIRVSWESATGLGEADHVKRLNDKDIKGVSQLLYRRKGTVHTKSFRPANFRGFVDKVQVIAVYSKPGVPAWYFTSRLQLLKGLLDVFLGEYITVFAYHCTLSDQSPCSSSQRLCRRTRHTSLSHNEQHSPWAWNRANRLSGQLGGVRSMEARPSRRQYGKAHGKST